MIRVIKNKLFLKVFALFILFLVLQKRSQSQLS
jgi:hypothetical protein